MTSKIAAFDLGLELGFAVGRETIEECGVEKFVSKEHQGERYTKALGFFTDFLLRHKPDRVAYEAVYHHGGASAAHCYGALEGLLMLACHRLALDLRFVSPAPAPKRGTSKLLVPEIRIISPKALKKYATGNGNADKEMMVDAAIRRWPEFKDQLDLGGGVINDDLADALWVHEAARLGIATEK